MNFYATIIVQEVSKYMPDNVFYLLPASSWARKMHKSGRIKPIRLPEHVKHCAADCGGFVATRIWGEYRYSPACYFEWLNSFPKGVLKWAATMDYCMEQEITDGKKGIIRERQHRTTHNAYLFWHEYRQTSWNWIPTVQGWEVEDYIYHARQLKPLIYEMRDHYGDHSYFRVGIGTLCARASTSMIQQVVSAVRQELPGIKFHLWGVKLNTIKSALAMPDVISVDSAAWNPGGLGSGKAAKEEKESMGISHTRYRYQIALPRYIAKFNKACSTSKQLPLI